MNDNFFAQLAKAVFEYDSDANDIHHLMAVHGYSRLIGQMEGLDERTQFILETAAFLHDIGVVPSRQKYGNSHAKHQEELGPDVARKILAPFNLDASDVERICFIIGHHHTYSVIDGTDFQILCEADYIVNLMEGFCKKESLAATKQNLFKTKSGLFILEKMFC